MRYRLWLLFISIVCIISAEAQSKAKTDKIAPFSIKRSDGKIFTPAQLKNVATILIYFSPDCEHCQHFTKEMIDNYQSLINDKQVVMVTYLAVNDVKHFEDMFELKNYKNIVVGTEEKTFVVRNYYGVTRFPFVALYDKAGKKVKAFADGPSFTDVTKFIKAL
ncbi:MAG: thioredoxin-like domain-containing protein [Agriterribacter sp.]